VNIAELSIKKNVITWMMTVLMIVVGLISYQNLARLEDPEFTIKQAVVITYYPGASAHEVEEEVTNEIEKAVQEMGQLDFVESKSSRHLSIVKVNIKDQYTSEKLPQVWDELRNKIDNYQKNLPPGAFPSIVNDDFGDVYGVYLAITGDGYSMAELEDWGEVLKREFLLAEDVKKVTLYGVIPEVVYVQMNREKMSALGIPPADIYRLLEAKNVAADGGRVQHGGDWIVINPTGEYTSEQQFGDLLISEAGEDRLVFLKDVATITRGYEEPPAHLFRFNGQPAIAVAVSTITGGNAVTVGNAVMDRLKELESQTPLGIEHHIISLQSEAVEESISSFLINLVEAILIVVFVLLIAMGIRSGLIIGFILFITICGTFIFMAMGNVTLERISLGALIIALGMLVDNAIVVTDGMKVRMEQGEDALSAAKNVVGQTAIPLLGATIVAICAFASLGFCQDSAGEYCRTLFSVILISLSLSWVTAVTVNPLINKYFLISKKKATGKTKKDPYSGKLFKGYKSLLLLALKQRWMTVGIVAAFFAVALYGFGFVDRTFFPTSSRPQYYVNFWLPEGSSIETTSDIMSQAEEYFGDRKEVKDVTTIIGGSEIRFLLVYPVEYAYRSYAQLLVTVHDYRDIDKTVLQVQEDLEEMFPDVIINLKKFLLGPGEGGKIQIRVSGPDYDTVRGLGEKVKQVILDDGPVKGLRLDWREKEKVIRPQLAEAQARRLGITRLMVARRLHEYYQGTPIGIYRERDELIDIVSRAPEHERINLEDLNNIDIWSPVEGAMIPLRQVVSGFETVYEDSNIWRKDRTPTLTIHADPVKGLPSKMLMRIKPKVEKALNVDLGQILGKKYKSDEDPFKDHTSTVLPTPYHNAYPLKGMPGYYLGWGGEAEDSAKSQAALGKSIPIFFGLMVVIVICLFNAIRQPLIIWLTVPLAIIGVTAGLLLFKQPFGFMSLLGALSLAGMLIKNAIVLIDQINTEIASGKESFQAIVDSGISRLSPVLLAAVTTIFGMAPLLQDPFFVSMAVTIMFGLGFATVLTLIFVPVLYAVFFKIPYRDLATVSSTETGEVAS